MDGGTLQRAVNRVKSLMEAAEGPVRKDQSAAPIGDAMEDFWRRQLEVCREHADGLVLWGGFKQLWDEEADWWVATKSFLGTEGINL